ncbi:flagellar export protein FliJ [Rhodanobacter sp. DHB23]|uniref:flagellar export protein FliJ n=1 Tax=Rhodanobacter sp. DHB23 TaxID=2775923 RepID=UPI001783424C|nr:flagellar export protein FliJ [Rhodanobacter sp. DHB23]MBD8871257.1 flagellar export protein FliJ [Rhodanobacter sp. DHB23]
MTPRSERLQPAADQARQKAEDALGKFAAQQQALAKAEQQLEELERYRREYAGVGEGAVSVSALLNRQQFVARIDQAIAQQVAEVGRQRRRLDQMRDHWKKAHARESALDSVIAQHQEHERRAEDRREQAEIDERMQHRRPR